MLSRGDQQMLTVARVLVKAFKLLMLDEKCDGLDS